MTFDIFTNKIPTDVKRVEIKLTIEKLRNIKPDINDPGIEQLSKTGQFAFDIVDAAGRVIESRSGLLTDFPQQINGTSINLTMLSNWLDELRDLALSTIPAE